MTPAHQRYEPAEDVLTTRGPLIPLARDWYVDQFRVAPDRGRIDLAESAFARAIVASASDATAVDALAELRKIFDAADQVIAERWGPTS